MKIGILGAGAMGCLFGGSLILGGSDITLFLRNKSKKNYLNKHGLRIKLNNKKHTVYPKALSVNEKGCFDIIMVFTKTNDTISALSKIKKSIDSKTVLMSLQNGLNNQTILAQFVKMSKVIYGTTMAPADLISPFEVSSHGTHNTEFKPAGKFSYKHADYINTQLNKVGFNSAINQNVDETIWQKVAFNSAMNSICALIEKTPNYIASDPKFENLAKCTAEETCSIAKLCGIRINVDQVKKTIDFSCKEHGNHKPSMLQDIMAKKRTEIDSLNGAIVKLGLNLKFSTPLNNALCNLIKAKENIFI